RTLRVGTILQASDLQVTGEEDVQVFDGLVGQELKRSVYAGRPVSPEDVGPVTVIRRNDVVSLVYASHSLGLRTEARALSAGGVGETISVMNIDTRVTVRATVVGHKRVAVSK
ncbi:MAG: flagellar basal body P-ring formation chaperone FlgA, partial [Pseudomonadota bacterium]